VSPLRYAKAWSLLVIDIVTQKMTLLFTHSAEAHGKLADDIFSVRSREL
jgi:hypothetical protein